MNARTAGRNRSPFALLWTGQTVSLLLSGATGVALGVWVFHETTSAAALAAVVATKSAITIYCAPVLGAVADRYPRRRLIVTSDLALAGCSALLLAFAVHGAPTVPAILVVVAVTGLFDGLLSVSMAAGLRDLRSEANLTRVNGLVSLLEASPTVVAPLLGAVLYQLAGLPLVLVLDGCSFVVAAVLAMSARWPNGSAARPTGRSAWPFVGAAQGFHLIFGDRDFARLQMVFAGVNALTGLGAAAVTAFLLASAGGGTTVLGVFSTTGAIGLLVGGFIVSTIGPRLSRPWAVVGGLGLAAIGGRVLLGLSPSAVGWVASAGLRSAGIQLSNAPLTALWQEQTAKTDQGKVFGARRLLGQGTFPLAVAAGGVIADVLARTCPGAGLAWFLLVLGAAEFALAALLHWSGAVQRLSHRSGVHIDSTRKTAVAPSLTGLPPRPSTD